MNIQVFKRNKTKILTCIMVVLAAAMFLTLIIQKYIGKYNSLHDLYYLHNTILDSSHLSNEPDILTISAVIIFLFIISMFLLGLGKQKKVVHKILILMLKFFITFMLIIFWVAFCSCPHNSEFDFYLKFVSSVNNKEVIVVDALHGSGSSIQFFENYTYNRIHYLNEISGCQVRINPFRVEWTDNGFIFFVTVDKENVAEKSLEIQFSKGI